MLWTWAIAGTLDFRPGGILAGNASPLVLSVLLLLFVFGVAKGRFTAPEDINADDDIIAGMFTGPGLSR
jgi:hypothetical protein